MLPGPMESLPAAKSKSPAPKSPNVVRPSETGFFAQHGNTILTAVLLVLAAVLAYRWWARSADNARQGVLSQLAAARQTLASQLQPAQLARLSPEQMAQQVKLVQTGVGNEVSDVINKADDASVKGRALVVRGDLNWAMANLPEVPGAATQPALRPDLPADQYLSQAADAYQAVTTLAGADKESVASAKLGLAAVAENRHDWPAAQQQLTAVADDKDDAVAVLAQAARLQLLILPVLEKPMYVAPAEGTPLAVPPAATMPAATMPTMPTSRPATMPMVPARPATMPMARPMVPKAPTTAPAVTRPTK